MGWNQRQSDSVRAAVPACARPGGFTLVEILIVVVILGIIAAIILPEITASQEDTSAAVAVSNLKRAVAAFRQYRQKHFAYPPEQESGVLPPEMAVYLKGFKWDKPTPIGGKWDWDYLQFGYTAGVSVYRPDRTDAEMTDIDAMFDDGDLLSGAFRKRNNGYMYILEH